MTAIGQRLGALRAHLAKEAACKERLSTFDGVGALLRSCYPRLDMEQAEIDASSRDNGTKKQWVIVCTRYVEVEDGVWAHKACSDDVHRRQIVCVSSAISFSAHHAKNIILTPTSSCLDNTAQSLHTVILSRHVGFHLHHSQHVKLDALTRVPYICTLNCSIIYMRVLVLGVYILYMVFRIRSHEMNSHEINCHEINFSQNLLCELHPETM